MSQYINPKTLVVVSADGEPSEFKGGWVEVKSYVENLKNALAWLIEECDTNYAFAEDTAGSEYEAVENARKLLE